MAIRYNCLLSGTFFPYRYVEIRKIWQPCSWIRKKEVCFFYAHRYGRKIFTSYICPVFVDLVLKGKKVFWSSLLGHLASQRWLKLLAGSDTIRLFRLVTCRWWPSCRKERTGPFRKDYVPWQSGLVVSSMRAEIRVVRSNPAKVFFYIKTHFLHVHVNGYEYLRLCKIDPTKKTNK
jgi:hypothetical protein